MDLALNPNYYGQDRPYKSKYICCSCRKSFKRKHASDIKGLDHDEVDAICPDCGEKSTWVGPKFRPPSSTNVKAWKSIEVMSRIGLLDFFGWANNPVTIPESSKALREYLLKLQTDCQEQVKKLSSANPSDGASKQIKYFSERLKKIATELEKL
ncbi:MAG: hypothetical protein H6582_03635 [Crocinitomicaceae bacterium]|nr:hypothetical protein [Crocinitomicaceae bacterium]MCB9223247.1 hypothetical protein [Crocinitomicaceae bacterium]